MTALALRPQPWHCWQQVASAARPRRLRSAGTRIKRQSLFVPRALPCLVKSYVTVILAALTSCLTSRHLRRWTASVRRPHDPWAPSDSKQAKHGMFGIQVPEQKPTPLVHPCCCKGREKKKRRSSYLVCCVMSWAWEEKRVIRWVRPCTACMRCSCAQCHHTAPKPPPSFTAARQGARAAPNLAESSSKNLTFVLPLVAWATPDHNHQYPRILSNLARCGVDSHLLQVTPHPTPLVSRVCG